MFSIYYTGKETYKVEQTSCELKVLHMSEKYTELPTPLTTNPTNGHDTELVSPSPALTSCLPNDTEILQSISSYHILSP
jgi:hypothetical protein